VMKRMIAVCNLQNISRARWTRMGGSQADARYIQPLDDLLLRRDFMRVARYKPE
jgi:hypothetical protein